MMIHTLAAARIGAYGSSPASVPIEWKLRGRGANGVVPGDRVPVAPMSIPSFGPAGSAPYAFGGGIADARHGAEMLVEGSAAVAGTVHDRIQRLMDAVPAGLFRHVDQIRVVQGQDIGFDRHFERAYRIPGFQAVAAGGNRQITFFGGRPYTDGVFLHEIGHNLPMLHQAWMDAAKLDDAHIDRLRGAATLAPYDFEQVPDPVRRARWAPRLAPGGLTPYADGQLRRGNTSEDIAEGVRLLLSERVFGHAFAIREPRLGAASASARGSARGLALPFEEAYPHRARLIESSLQALAASSRQ